MTVHAKLLLSRVPWAGMWVVVRAREVRRDVVVERESAADVEDIPPIP